MSSNKNDLPDFSSLAAKPPQRPTENLASRPSTSNYQDAVAQASTAAAEREKQASFRPGNLTLDGSAQAAVDNTQVVSPTSASWRPDFNRQQSFSAQEHKRAMQSPLMSPKLERGANDYGFSSKDDDRSQTQLRPTNG